MAETKGRAEWRKANTKVFAIRLNNKIDADIIKHLDGQPSYAGEIKRLLKEAIKRGL